jgi:hypothetical protein
MLDDKKDRIYFYDNVIAPYKGELEEWYVNHQDLNTYFKLIGLTIWVIIFPDSKIYKEIFNDLPKPPKELEEYI